MTTHNEEIVRRLYEEILNGRQWESMSDVIAADHSLRDPSSPPADGPDGFAEHARMYADAFEAHWAIEDMVCTDENVVVHWVGTGTHVAELQGIPATGRSFRIDGINMHAIRDGMIAWTFGVWDTYGLMTQIGVIPSPANA